MSYIILYFVVVYFIIICYLFLNYILLYYILLNFIFAILYYFNLYIYWIFYFILFYDIILYYSIFYCILFYHIQFYYIYICMHLMWARFSCAFHTFANISMIQVGSQWPSPLHWQIASDFYSATQCRCFEFVHCAWLGWDCMVLLGGTFLTASDRLSDRPED